MSKAAGELGEAVIDHRFRPDDEISDLVLEERGDPGYPAENGIRSFRVVNVPDPRRICPIIPLAEFSGDALALFRTQVDIILDVPSFLFLEALEYFHDLGHPLHKDIISHHGF